MAGIPRREPERAADEQDPERLAGDRDGRARDRDRDVGRERDQQRAGNDGGDVSSAAADPLTDPDQDQESPRS